MKRNYLLTSMFIVFLLVGFNNCSEGDEPSRTDEQLYLEKLSKTWVVDEVTLDGLDVTDIYTTMALSVTADQTFTVTNPQPGVWPASGSFTIQKIADSEHYKLIRNDGIEINITSLTPSELTCTFQYVATDGRVGGLSGVYSFAMTPAE